MIEQALITPPEQKAIVQLRDLDDTELELLAAIDVIPPRTIFKIGDIAHLIHVPPWLHSRTNAEGRLPYIWQIRLIVSKWAYECWCVTNNLRREGVWYDAVEHYGSVAKLLATETRIPTGQRYEPVLYAHGYPHAAWPNTASWFSPRHFVRDYVKSPHENWEVILDAAHTEYMGIHPLVAPNGFAIDLAPDLYAQGQKFSNPFFFEESSFNTLSALGYEEAAVNGIDPKRYTPMRSQESGRIVF